MTATTKGVFCPAGAWTMLSNAKASVLVSLRNIGAAYLKTASETPVASPHPDATPGDASFDFISVSSGRPASFAFVDTSTNVYLFPAGDRGLVVEVVAE